ncbi:phage major capsid protein [Lentilitoribacter sp. EG35]|uniref:phage major capsid protein n=1 Tax=Lentilitoribacter sp. EG35 TaxID=3234192 RepID=UPI003460AA8B
MSAEIKKLREEQASIATNARSKFDEITSETPEARAQEIEREFDTMMAEHDKIGERVERLEKLEAAERSVNAPDPRRPGGNVESREPLDDDNQTLDYRAAFHEMLSAGGDMSEVSAEARAVLRRGVADSETRAQLTSSNAAGGFTVPTELSETLIEAMEATGPMYSDIVFTMNTSGGGEIELPTIDDTGDSSTAIHTEGSDVADDASGDVVFGQRVLNSYLYKTPFVKWSMELNSDSIFNIESLLSRLLGKRLGKIANQKLTTGSGTNEPNGIVTAASLGITAAGTASITSDELINMQDALDEAYENGGTGWMMNKQTRSAIRKLKDGDGNYLWQMGNIKEGTPQSLLERPIRLNEAMAVIATGTRPIIYGDFKEYYVRKVGDPILGVMREKFWPNLGIAGLIRIDGEIGDDRAIKALLMS